MRELLSLVYSLGNIHVELFILFVLLAHLRHLRQPFLSRNAFPAYPEMLFLPILNSISHYSQHEYTVGRESRSILSFSNDHEM